MENPEAPPQQDAPKLTYAERQMMRMRKKYAENDEYRERHKALCLARYYEKKDAAIAAGKPARSVGRPRKGYETI